MTRNLLSINGHRIYVETHGPRAGRPVVLLHQGLGAVRSWKEQIPVLAEAGYRVIAYDRWGHGKSDAREKYGMPTFEQDRADLECLLCELEVGRAFLAGHSDGGKIAMYFAADHPEQVSGLVLVAAHIYIESKMGIGIQNVQRQYQEEARFREKLRRVHGDKAETLFAGWTQGWINPAWLDWDMRPVLRDIACPTLVVQGLEDEHATPGHAREIAKGIRRAEIWLAPETGHMLPRDAAGEFNRRLLEFLERGTKEE